MSDRATRACAAAALSFAMAICTPVAPAQPAVAPARSPAAAPTVPPVAAAAGGAAEEDIRDIRGPKSISPAWLIPALLAGALVLAAVGYGAWRWKRGRQAPKALLAFEIALQRLEEIRRLLDPASVREFSIAISDIVREYIEAAFKVTATHRTTEEFLHDLLESPHAALGAHRDLLAQFLEQCDVAKFAGMALSRPILESLYRSARAFVVQTAKPAPAADAPGIDATPEPPAHDSLPST